MISTYTALYCKHTTPVCFLSSTIGIFFYHKCAHFTVALEEKKHNTQDHGFMNIMAKITCIDWNKNIKEILMQVARGYSFLSLKFPSEVVIWMVGIQDVLFYKQVCLKLCWVWNGSGPVPELSVIALSWHKEKGLEPCSLPACSRPLPARQLGGSLPLWPLVPVEPAFLGLAPLLKFPRSLDLSWQPSLDKSVQ